MHETLGDGYVVDGGKRVYADEDPGVRDATQFRHEEANSFQEEIANVIRAEGYSLNPPTETIGQMNQLNTAIDKKVSDGDAAEAVARTAAISAESSARAAADASLQSQINNLGSDDIDNDSAVSGSNVSDALDNLQSAISVSIPRGYIDGYRLGGGGGVNMSVGAGICRDATDSLIIESSGMTKDISSAWVQGNSNGGFGGNDGGPNNGNWYYAFALYKSGQPVDFGIDNNASGSNLLSASTYTHARRLGAIFYESGAIRPFYQKGDWFYHYISPISETVDLNTGSGGYKAGTKQVCPNGIDDELTDIILGLSAPANNDGGSGVYVNIYPATMSGSYAVGGSSDFFDAANDANGIKHCITQKRMSMPSNMNVQGLVMIIGPASPSVACNITYRCFGWRDKRGKDA